MTNEDMEHLDEAIKIVNSNKDCLMHFKDNNELIKEMAQLKILHFPHEDLKLDFSNTRQAYLKVASQLL